jgi:2-polyprenyl-6-methoxyphenol hydroxylase-like FAD-dependent oxidoreductase
VSQLNRVLIAGGGIVGLTAAIALRRTGTDVVVFEQAPEIRAIGASIGLWENALRAFDFLGVGDDVRRIGRPAEMVFHDPSGHLLTTPEFGPEDHSYLLVGRPQLNDLLADAVGRERIRLLHRVEAFDESADGVTIHLSNGTTETGDLLIGADGVFSAVRGQLAPEARVREHIGHLSWRAILPQTPTRIERDVLVIGHERCRGGYLRRPGEGAFWLVAQFESPPLAESARTECLLRAARLDDGGWNSQLRELIAATPEDSILFNQTMIVPPPDRWASRRAVLMGDAAHGMSPHVTAGASLGVQDPVVLVRCLDEAPELAAALAAYEADRNPHYAEAQRLSAAVERYATPAEFAHSYAAFSHWMIRS